MKPKVFLGDQEVDKVYCVDEELGIIWRYKLDREGKHMFNHDRSKLLTQVLKGKVRLEFGPLSSKAITIFWLNKIAELYKMHDYLKNGSESDIDWQTVVWTRFKTVKQNR